MTELSQHCYVFYTAHWIEICVIVTKGRYEVAVLNPQSQGPGAARGRGESWQLANEK